MLNIFALYQGDVSVATPLLGTKVLFVALFTIVALNEQVSLWLWLSAILVFIGLKMLHGGVGRMYQRFW